MTTFAIALSSADKYLFVMPILSPMSTSTMRSRTIWRGEKDEGDNDAPISMVRARFEPRPPPAPDIVPSEFEFECGVVLPRAESFTRCTSSEDVFASRALVFFATSSAAHICSPGTLLTHVHAFMVADLSSVIPAQWFSALPLLGNATGFPFT